LSRTVQHDGVGAPPLTPPPFDFDLLVDEGPMRGDLRRQIAWLERDLTRLRAIACPWAPMVTHATRGPGLMSGHELEQIRDELLAAVRDLRRRIAGEAPAR
jgi:hypothetical protein